MPSAVAVGASLAALASMPAAPSEPAYQIAHLEKSTPLYERAAGQVVARLGATTEFGSPQTLGVVRHRGQWLAVVSTARPNRRLGWIRARDVRLTRTRMSLTLDLSQRRLLLKRGDEIVRRMTVGIGRASSPTPIGRFAVTDKLSGGNYGPYYGCCIVALSAHQPNLPAGWTGGDRIAIHGTNAPWTIGTASSAGCPHARDADLRVLMRRVQLGAPVFVRA
jgi:lipoprotein-anchoring transpeptidase ErfK/SrfK